MVFSSLSNSIEVIHVFEKECIDTRFFELLGLGLLPN
jgi:hypothetical protein